MACSAVSTINTAQLDAPPVMLARKADTYKGGDHASGSGRGFGILPESAASTKGKEDIVQDLPLHRFP